MGLHHSYLDFIQKNQLDAVSRSNLKSIHSSLKEIAASRYKRFFKELQSKGEQSEQDLKSGVTLPELKSLRSSRPSLKVTRNRDLLANDVAN